MVYSAERAAVAYKEHDWKRHWQSVANFAQAAVRDALLYATFVGTVTEPIPIAIIHTMGEALSDKLTDYFTNDSVPELKINNTNKPIEHHGNHVVVAGSTEAKARQYAEQIFKNKAKGVHQFHRAVFQGKIVHPVFAPKGENIQLHLQQGLYDGAQCDFAWKWTVDSSGARNRPESTWGKIRLSAGNPTKFGLSERRGVGWEGYDFWGDILGNDLIRVYTRIDGGDMRIDLTRRK